MCKPATSSSAVGGQNAKLMREKKEIMFCFSRNQDLFQNLSVPKPNQVVFFSFLKPKYDVFVPISI